MTAETGFRRKMMPSRLKKTLKLKENARMVEVKIFSTTPFTPFSD